MTKDDALKLALKALEAPSPRGQYDAITAIKQALEQPEPAIDAQKIVDGFFDYHKQRETQSTHSAAWCLCEPNKCDGVGRCRWQAMNYSPLDLRQKEAEKQEPVAFIDMREWPPIRWRDGMVRADVAPFDGQGLYLTSPPQRQWVGLTDEEIETIYADCSAWDKFEYERMLEAKLKQKNGYTEENT
jgi:hypothetical protein